uniref:Uncharacterized protein n=3 Tax=Vibrionaceae TaxID=641 RepID=A0A0H3ZZL8_VIBSP|nr:hypothetical protein [Vibrio sp. FF_482]AKN38587.1 hypothetical protein [Enterovibrio norvegicus]AKN39359.1 hypothetical protein [Vibrio splendidus]
MLDSEIIYRITNAKAHFLQGSLVSFVTEIDHRYAHPQYQGMKMQVFVFALERQRPQAQWEPIAIARQALHSRREQRVIHTLMNRGWYQPRSGALRRKQWQRWCHDRYAIRLVAYDLTGR